MTRDDRKRALARRPAPPLAHIDYQPADPPLGAVASQARRPVRRSDRAGAIEHGRELVHASRHFRLGQRDAGPFADRASQQFVQFGVQDDVRSRLPTDRRAQPVALADLEQHLHALPTGDVQEHPLALPMLFAIQPLHAAVAQQ